MDNRAIGVFDSGLGGLTAVRELRRLLPFENIVYFGDTGRVPYGTRSRETLHRYTCQDIAFLKKHDVKLIVAACGTVSATITPEIISDTGLPFTGVVAPTAAAAVVASKTGRIGVLGTGATVKSGAFDKAIKKLAPSAQVFSKACPLFVPLVENGMIERECEITRLTAEMYLKDLKKENIDTLILGCTHFPIIADIIADVMGEGVSLIDSGKATSQYVRDLLIENDMTASRGSIGECRYFVSDSAEDFSRLAGLFLGEEAKGEVQHIEIE